MGLLGRIAASLSRTRAGLADAVRALVHGGTRLEPEVLEDLEAALIQADTGAGVASRLVEDLRQAALNGGLPEGGARNFLESKVQNLLGAEAPLVRNDSGVTVVFLVGVNGSGKTTTTGKLAHRLAQQGEKVLLAGADTFRAAAAEQLEMWAERAGVPIVRHQAGADPGAVVFDSLQSALARGITYVLVDTAGRLQTKDNLMKELEKLSRVAQRLVPGAPHETLLVLDGTVGQNALSQARAFKEAAGLTGLVLTKLDGTAKGGVVLALRQELGVPVKFVGVGEGIDDLEPFDAAAFAGGLFS